MFTLEDFTPELKAKMEPFANDWVSRRLSTERADRPVVESGIRDCYVAADLGWHNNIIWTSSPLLASMVGPIMAHTTETMTTTAVVSDTVMASNESAIKQNIRMALEKIGKS